MGWTKRRVAWAVAAYLLLFAMRRPEKVVYAVGKVLATKFPVLTFPLYTLYLSTSKLFTEVYPLLVLLGTLFGGAIAVVRIWRRAAAGTARDPLVQLRDALRAHRQLASALPWLPFAYWLCDTARTIGSPTYYGGDLENALSSVVDGVATMIVGKLLLRALDRVQDREAPPPPQVAPDETVFRAVAVTRRSQAIVMGALGVAVAMIAFMSSVNLARFGMGPLSMLALVYTLGLGVTARWFQTASKIRVGSDGVFVQGTSKTRFYSYRDFDSVRVSGATLHLLRGTKTVIRLQLHGDDLHRGAFLAERIETALAAAMNVSGAESLLAHGGRALAANADYRNASLSREQLWEIVEADGTAGDARAAAAKMLAVDLDADDRSRLRVAAAHTAEPRVRVALETCAGEAEGEEESPALLALPRRRAEER